MVLQKKSLRSKKRKTNKASQRKKLSRRAHLEAAEEDIRKGRVHGPFQSTDELFEYARKFARTRRGRVRDSLLSMNEQFLMVGKYCER